MYDSPLERGPWSLTLSQGLGQQGGSAYLTSLRPEREAQGSYMQVQTHSWSQVSSTLRKGGKRHRKKLRWRWG